MRQFEVGTTYETRSFCDWDCVFRFEIVARSKKTITIKRRDGSLVNRRVIQRDEAEMCFPDGRYSMAPVINA
jgi:hypothetical protein